MRHPGLAFATVIVGTIGIAVVASAIPPAGRAPVTAAHAMVDGASTGAKAPVLVELFTSEGCSSCPPADRLLAKLQQTDPDLIVLSEHVTYWNEIGWKDPFSSHESTGRQSDYVDRLHLSSSYTPQMVVNGRYEFVGSDADAAAKAIQKATAMTPVAITLSNIQMAGQHLSFSVATGPVSANSQLIVALAQDEGTEHVSNGENGGRTLRHVQIARTIRQVADVKAAAPYGGNVTLDVPSPIAGSGWHVVVFLQQGSGGPIAGVASHAV